MFEGVALVGQARTLQIEEIDAPIVKYSAKMTLRGVTDFNREVEARWVLIAQQRAQLPNAVGGSSLTEHTYNTVQWQFMFSKQQNFVTLCATNQPKFESSSDGIEMEVVDFFRAMLSPMDSS